MEGTCKCPACGYLNFFSQQRVLQAATEPLHCWHCEAFIDHLEVPLEPIINNRFQHLAGKRVEMWAAGILYRGVFVEMTDETEGRKAIEAMANFETGGRTLVVNEARPRNNDRGGPRPRRDDWSRRTD